MGLTETVCQYVCVCDSENVLLVCVFPHCECADVFFSKPDCKITKT